MAPLIVIRKSMWSILWTFIWTILLSFLIIPIFYLIYKILLVRKTYSEVYDNRVIDYHGVFNITKSEHTLTKVIGVNTHKPFLGNLLGYGNIHVELIGNYGVNFTDVANLDKIEKYFRELIVDGNNINQSIME